MDVRLSNPWWSNLWKSTRPCQTMATRSHVVFQSRQVWSSNGLKTRLERYVRNDANERRATTWKTEHYRYTRKEVDEWDYKCLGWVANQVWKIFDVRRNQLETKRKKKTKKINESNKKTQKLVYITIQKIFWYQGTSYRDSCSSSKSSQDGGKSTTTRRHMA